MFLLTSSSPAVAYVPQRPWLLNATVRDNILFGEPLRARRYDRVLRACALRPDIELMPDGDLAEIGERGIKLSGGQRQRIAIARALYSPARLVIMDDPLSSLDNEVARFVFDHGIRRMLARQKRTAIVVTQRLQLAFRADNCCADSRDRHSGIQIIQPQPGFGEPFGVYCDQDYEGGGWTVIQNRYDGSVNFYRGWKQYEDGFGSMEGEFWLGLKKIHELTYSKKYELVVLMDDWEGYRAVARYSRFSVAGPEENYTLKSVGNYSGTAGDSLSFQVGMKFSTLDVDNDTHEDGACAVMYQGAWWYAVCHQR
ncbi:hypothetical protein quinque_004715 [Culex quinquefasciatus]